MMMIVMIMVVMMAVIEVRLMMSAANVMKLTVFVLLLIC